MDWSITPLSPEHVFFTPPSSEDFGLAHLFAQPDLEAQSEAQSESQSSFGLSLLFASPEAPQARPPLVTHLEPEPSLTHIAPAAPALAQCCPWLVMTIVVIYMVMYIITMYVNHCRRHTFPPSECSPRFLGRFSFQPQDQNPMYGPSHVTLIHMGGLYLNNGLHIHQPWRLLTNIWLHEGLTQLGTDVTALLGAAILLERKFGSVRVGLVYLLSGFAGSLFSALFFQTGVIVGAYGALAGLTAASLSDIIIEYFILHLDKGFDCLIAIMVMLFTIGATVLQHGDNFAIIGGSLVGFAVGFVIFARPPVNKLRCTVILIVIIAGLVTSIVMVLKGVNMNEHCPWCHYVDCVPFPGWKCKYRGNVCEKRDEKQVVKWNKQKQAVQLTKPFSEVSFQVYKRQ